MSWFTPTLVLRVATGLIMRVNVRATTTTTSKIRSEKYRCIKFQIPLRETVK